jgi:hypothetical protein
MHLIRVNVLAFAMCPLGFCQTTLITFEPPLPSGLVAMSFLEDTAVTPQSRITNQYGNLGILMSNVALVDLGVGQADSGTNGIAPISSTGTIDYGSAATFTFVDPSNSSAPGVTDYFAIMTDRDGGSGNTTTVSGYDINGKFLGSASSPDIGGVTLQLQNIGQIHSVVVKSTLINHNSGGIALDNVQFGAVMLAASNPPPPTQPVAGDSQSCTNANITGPYGYTISGLVFSNGGFVPVAESGSVTADGKGNLTGSGTFSQGGQIQSQAFNGTYTVNSDCTGTVTTTDSTGPSHFTIVAVNNGQQILFIESDPMFAVSGSANQQQTSCTTESLNGAYGFAITGWTYDSSGNGWGFAESGKVVADNGNLSMEGTVSETGAISSGTLVGNYSVDSNCTGTAALANSQGSTFHFNFVLVSGGSQVQFIQTDSNTVISGSASTLGDVTPPTASIARVASGSGWQTTFTLSNTGTSSAQVKLTFFDNNGNPLSLPLTFEDSGTKTTTSSLSQTIATGNTLVVATSGTATEIGSAQLSATGTVGGFATYQFNSQQSTAPFQTNATAYILAFDNTSGASTTIDVANITSQSANVPVTIRDDKGNTLGTETITLPAHGHTSFKLASQYSFTTDKRGRVEFDTPPNGQISALGLRTSSSGSLTTIPVLAK